MDDNQRQTLLVIIHDWEGVEFVNHPLDRGGPTKYGITKATYENYLGRNVTVAEVASMSLSVAMLIYERFYVDGPRIGEIKDPALFAAVLDMAINSGSVRAIKTLQTCVGVVADGIIGPKTLAAIDAIPDKKKLLKTFITERLRFYARIVEQRPNQAVFLEGWVRRAMAWL